MSDEKEEVIIELSKELAPLAGIIKKLNEREISFLNKERKLRDERIINDFKEKLLSDEIIYLIWEKMRTEISLNYRPEKDLLAEDFDDIREMLEPAIKKASEMGK